MKRKIRCSRCFKKTQDWKPSITFDGQHYSREKLCTECSRVRAAVIRAARADYAARQVAKATPLDRVRLFIVVLFARVFALIRKVTT